MFMEKKRVVYLGNRDICYGVICEDPRYIIVKIITFSDCALQRRLSKDKVEHEIVSESDREYVVQLLMQLSFDILVVNGCPFILPASQLKSLGKILLNTHPSYLPYLRGKRPVNGCILFNYPPGATTHYITDKIDGGNIIYQEKVDLTPDLDLGLCYYISFSLEERVFRRALAILEESDYKFIGSEIDTLRYPLFTNSDSLREIDFQSMTAEECVKRIRSYGIEGEGCFANINGQRYIIYDAEYIVNTFLLDVMHSFEAGRVVLTYGSTFLIKCCKGILKIKRYQKMNN